MSYSSQVAEHIGPDPRQAEYEVFDQVTQALESSKDKGAEDEAYRVAIDSNRRLWSALGTDLSSPKNRLPDQLKAQILSLALWVDKHSTLAIRGEAKVDALITVNQAIMKGLAA